MNSMGRELFETWAPDASPWSAWVKPVLFAWIHHYASMPESSAIAAALPDPAASSSRAWVIDLEGTTAIRTGIALAGHGVRPIPLFNGVPSLLNSAIDVSGIVAILASDAGHLAAVPDFAPPAFLLDARRNRPATVLRPGMFDNRWQVAPQDFPSASRLQQAGITEVVLVAESVQTDLAHVLLRWQEAGLQLRQWHPQEQKQVDLMVRRPQWYRSIWWRVLVMGGLRPNSTGGFGDVIPDPQSSGGYG